MNKELKVIKETIENLTFISNVLENTRKKLKTNVLFEAQTHIITAIEKLKEQENTLNQIQKIHKKRIEENENEQA